MDLYPEQRICSGVRDRSARTSCRGRVPPGRAAHLRPRARSRRGRRLERHVEYRTPGAPEKCANRPVLSAYPLVATMTSRCPTCPPS